MTWNELIKQIQKKWFWNMEVIVKKEFNTDYQHKIAFIQELWFMEESNVTHFIDTSHN